MSFRVRIFELSKANLFEANKKIKVMPLPADAREKSGKPFLWQSQCF